MVNYKLVTAAAVLLVIGADAQSGLANFEDDALDLLNIQTLATDGNMKFDGDEDVTFQQVQEAFGEETAVMARDASALAADEDEEEQGRRLGTPGRARLWPGGNVKYYIPPAATHFNSTETNIIANIATDMITSRTGITFQRITSTNQGRGGYISFNGNKASGCSSPVGWQGRGQTINLKTPEFRKDPHCMWPSTVAHEIMHSLGMWHEQSMGNRGQYLNVLDNNIQPRAAFNFNVQQGSKTLGIVYDYESNMHYGQFAFGKDTGEKDPETDRTIYLQTMQAKDFGTNNLNPENSKKMGSGQLPILERDLTNTDAIQLQIMYHCAIENPSANPNSGSTYGYKTLSTLCSPQCPCNKGQGNCRTNADCKNGLMCKENVGAYTWLLDEPYVSSGLNVCVEDDGTGGPVRTDAPTPFNDGIGGPEPEVCECDGGSALYEQCSPYEGRTVCYIKYSGSSIKPDCEGEVILSTTTNRWYKYGCDVNSNSGLLDQQFEFVPIDGPIEAAKTGNKKGYTGGEVGQALGFVVGAVAGVALVGVAVIKYKDSQKPHLTDTRLSSSVV